MTTRPIRSQKQHKKRRTFSRLVVRLDPASKTCLVQAAELRGISVSDYVREVAVAQARREVLSAQEGTIALTPDEQLAFWKALTAPAKLTKAQKQLGKVMGGDH
jgi:uncharacterized protein (DUF1778 family)